MDKAVLRDLLVELRAEVQADLEALVQCHTMQARHWKCGEPLPTDLDDGRRSVPVREEAERLVALVNKAEAALVALGQQGETT